MVGHEKRVRVPPGEVSYFKWLPNEDGSSALRVVTARRVVLVSTRDHRMQRTLMCRQQTTENGWMEYEQRGEHFLLCVFNSADESVDVQYSLPLVIVHDVDMEQVARV